jgi:hypothetical protein
MPREPEPSRRDFLEAGARGLAGAAMLGAAPAASRRADRARDATRAFLDARLPKAEWIDAFLDPAARVWARFDPELGYLLRNSFVRDGVDGAHTLARYEATGQRQQAHFRDQPCRINTYGDSFTQGHQVSDGETWQEVLAAHFCEPIRNFGIGGFGVYQAYRRLLRNEATDLGAPFLILNIWGDDHYRSVYSWRWLSFPAEVGARMGALMFHSNPWAHARLDPTTGALVERPNPCPTPESVRRLTDAEFVHATFADDPIVRVLAARDDPAVASDPAPFEELASACGFEGLDLTGDEAIRRSAGALLHAYSLRVGMRIIEALAAYCRDRGKRLFVLLSHPSGSVWHHCERPADDPHFVDWHPRAFQEFVRGLGVPVLDTVEKHVAEFRTFRISAKEYVDRYYIGHYTPTGNHFFAYAVKDELLGWLDPKPPAYRGGDDETLIRFRGYLPG